MKCCRAFRMPVSIPDTPNRIGEISISRVSETASVRSSATRPLCSPSPGASSGTIHGASRNATTATTVVATLTRLSTSDATRQPACSPMRIRMRLYAGMNAEESVAPASS